MRLLVSQDPVALDYTGWQIIERKRAEKGLKTLEGEERAPHYIATAADNEHRLGTNDPGESHLDGGSLIGSVSGRVRYVP